ncbi:hypothetical protein [Wolbachia endosymbiont (group B) of Longitarsus flavicornis]|uniref:hypothetical protein n=1 Tax=Wolbachia endosymbiont (group B) of Longitarsus flavicornis TaxID=3066135 RepID=UPI0033405C7B
MHNTGLARNLLDGNCQEFIRDFRSFLGQCPSFLHSVGKDRFFPAFFFGMLATAHDSGVANNERVFFRFDNDPNNRGKGNLKIAILTNKRDREGYRTVKCFTVSDRENSPGSRFSQQERQQVEALLDGQDDFVFEEYKIFAWKQNQVDEDEVECRRIEDGEFTANSASPCNGFDEITRTPGLQNNRIPNLISNLADNDAENVRGSTRRILQYILDTYDGYYQLLNDNNRPLNFNGIESDHHGFLSGFLMNFGHRHGAGVYLELFVGGGYTDITFLVRGVQRLGDSVSIIIELKAGRRSAADALEQAENYVNRCPISSLSIHTSSGNAVCVGLNFDLNRRRFSSSVEDFLEREHSLVERLFEPVGNREIEENVEDYLLYPAFGVPAVPGIRNRDGVSARDRRVFLYTTGFAFSNIAFARGTVQIEQNRIRVTKYLFRYHDDDMMLGPQGGISQVNVGDRALTMVLHVLRGRNQREEVVVFNVHHTLAHQFPNIGLNLPQSWKMLVYMS